MTLDEAKAKLQAAVDEVQAEGFYLWPYIDGIVVGNHDETALLDTEDLPPYPGDELGAALRAAREAAKAQPGQSPLLVAGSIEQAAPGGRCAACGVEFQPDDHVIGSWRHDPSAHDETIEVFGARLRITHAVCP